MKDTLIYKKFKLMKTDYLATGINANVEISVLDGDDTREEAKVLGLLIARKKLKVVGASLYCLHEDKIKELKN